MGLTSTALINVYIRASIRKIPAAHHCNYINRWARAAKCTQMLIDQNKFQSKCPPLLRVAIGIEKNGRRPMDVWTNIDGYEKWGVCIQRLAQVNLGLANTHIQPFQ